MKRSLTPLTIFLRSSTTPYYFSCHSFSSSSSSSSVISQKKNDEDAFNRNVKVLVWWDFENCPVPNGSNALNVAKNITCALRANGIKGPVTITAFGDFIQLSRSTQEFLSSTGVILNHVPSGGKNTADRSLLADLVFWVSQNPPPAHLFLISGDKDFASILHRLRMNNYNILLASRDPAPGVLCSAASIMWRWYELVRGESFSGKQFNAPPDGPWESWYGHERGPLEDPFPDMGQPTPVQTEDSPDAVTGSKPRAIPKTLVNRIRQVVNSYPKGVNISVLHSELGRSNMPIDADYFGYKKFSVLLKSLPTILKLQSAGDGQIFAHGIQSKVVQPVTQPKVAEPADQPKVGEPVAQPKISEPVDQPKIAELDNQPKVARPLNQAKVGEAVGSKLTDLKANDGDRSRTVNAESSAGINCVATDAIDISSVPAYSQPKTDPPQIGPNEKDVGFLQRALRNVFGHSSNASDNGSNKSLEICSTSVDSFDKKEQEEKSFLSSVPSSNLNEQVLEEKSAINSEENDKTIPRVGMLGKMVRWFKPLKTSSNPNNSHFGEEVNKMNTQIDNSELFLKVSFWDDMLLFLQSPKGLALISESKNREHMAQQLQAKGPPLDTLATGDLIHLVDLLISKKNWVEESISGTFPYKLAHPARTSPSSSNPHSSEQLSSMFLRKSSKSNLSLPPGHGRDNGKNKDTPPGGCSNERNQKPSGRSNSEILADCQKLVAETLKEQPEGFNISIFKMSFREKYGYNLDHQKLGYPKLASLLQTIPGVVVEVSFVLPSVKSQRNVIPYSLENDGTVKVRNLDSELSDNTRKGSDDDSMWEEELGPISETESKRKCSNSGINGKTDVGTVHADFDDRNYFSDEFSDSEEESLAKDGKRLSEADSSLLRILDSYAKNDKNNELAGCSRNDLKNSGLKKPRRIYSFISDKVEDEKEKPEKGNLGSVDEQEKLGTLKKSSDSKLQS